MSIIELEIAFSARENHLHPDSHELRRRSDQKEIPIMSLDHECGLGVRTLYRAHVIHVDLVYRLEIDRASQLGLVLVRVVAQRSLHSIEHEPALVPGLEGLPAHFEQVAAAGGGVQLNLRLVGAMSTRLHVLAQVEVALSHRQVASERPSLNGGFS